MTGDPRLGPLQRAIVALRQARERIEALERGRNEPIAIVGMACRFPGGEDLEGFWRLLQQGGSAVTEVPPDRWSLADYHDPRPGTPGRMVSRHGGFLERVFEFDAARFGISTAEAEAMDPQQRLLLEVAAEAFERAGDATLEGSSTGVFVGISTHDYAQHTLRDEAPEQIGVYTGSGNAFSTAAGRVAYAFGLQGPCVAIDTACSSSLVATHLACQSLRADECERALVGGVNVLLAPSMSVYFDRLGVLAPDGVCRAFDARARGYARAEGCGVLVLRRLADAVRDGDPIVAVIRGSAINHNGRANGLTSPSRSAQAEVIRRAMRAAAVTPAQLGYVEAFGAGTPMGDSVELRALADVLASGRSTPLPIGSVKTNLGHTEAAAGTASLIKTVLSLERGELVPSLHFEQPNPAIADRGAPVRVVRAVERWPEGQPRIAGVSGFGFGGTNAHVVLEAPPSSVACSPGRRASLPPRPFERREYRAKRVVPLRHAPASPTHEQPPAELVDAPLPRRRDAIEQWLRTQLSALLHQPPAELPPETSLVDLGLGSLAVVEAIQAIQRELRIQVYPEELLGARSIEELAAHLARELGRRHGAGEPREAPSALRESARAHVHAFGRASSSSPSTPKAACATEARTERRLPAAVLLLGAPRCGSTLLRVMLAGHPQLFAPPELHLLAHQDMGQWYRALVPRMMHLGLVQALVGTGLDEGSALARVRGWVADEVPTAWVYAELQRSIGERRLVDKSPSYALDPAVLARAESLFDGPRYLLLARHPYAAIESFTRLRMEHLLAARGLDPHLVAEETWARAYASLDRLAHEVGPGRCHRIAYESLVTRPEPVLRELCEFLGLPFDPATLTPYAGDRMVPAGDRAIGFIGDPEFRRHAAIEPELAERWKEARLPWRLDAGTVAQARTLGYQTPAEAPAALDDPEADTSSLPADFTVAPAKRRSRPGELLLTGATGFLGVHLLAELMTQTDGIVRCLVRARDADAASQRVRAAMEHHGLWRSEHSARIVVDPADLAAESLGLSARRWAALADEVEAIYHNGAVVHFAHPYAALRAPNVEGTRRMLQLAAQASSKPFFFVSTKGVFAADAYPEGEPIAEDEPLRPIPGALGYQQSKSVAERLVWAASARGLATAVYRPGRLGGHGVTGQVDPDDLLCRFLIGCVQLGALPDIALPLELSPVDQVAAAIVRISRSAGATGLAYHLVHSAPIEVAEVRRVLAAAGLELGLVPWDDWRAALRAQPRNALAPLSGLFGVEPPRRVHEARLSTRNTAAVDPSFAPPAIAEQLARNVAYMQRLRMFDDRGPTAEGDPT